MNPDQVEDLLRRIPDLAPSPDLEARIIAAAKRRTVVRRRIPALIPAAAAFLFCVGVVISVVATLSTPGGKGKSEPAGPFVIQFLQEEKKWVVSPPDFHGMLSGMKERGVVFAGPPQTPWGLVQNVRRACVKAGFLQVEWRIADKILKVAIPPPPSPATLGAPDKIRLEDIQVIIYRDRDLGGIVRRVGNRKPVESDEELMNLILTMRGDYKKAGKTAFPVDIDANVDVPWQEIAHVVEMCTKEGFGEIYLDPPTPPFKIGDPLWTPEKRYFPRPEDK